MKLIELRTGDVFELKRTGDVYVLIKRQSENNIKVRLRSRPKSPIKTLHGQCKVIKYETNK